MKKYNSIMSQFTKAISKLEKLIEKNQDEAAVKEHQRRVLQTEINLLDDETEITLRTVDRLKDLTGAY